MLVASAFSGVVHAEELFRSYGYTNAQYENIASSCMTNITWDRKVHRIEIIRNSSHTLYVDFFDVRASSVTDGVWTSNPSTGAYHLDQITGKASPNYFMDRSTTIAPNFGVYYFNAESDGFSVWIPSHTNLNTPDVDVNGWGW